MVLVARQPFAVNHGLTASLSSHSNEWMSSIVPVPNHRRPWSPKSPLKGLFAGSGNGAMSHPYFAQSVVDLTKRSPQEVNLLYIGTASYDLARYRDIQTSAFAALGCTIHSLDVANQSPLLIDLEDAVEKAHIILVSGGNTLYAVDRWRALGLDGLLKDAAHRGVVMTGGSAGCICWFDGGHSDSMDPDTYRVPMLSEVQQENPNAGASNARTSAHFNEGASAIGNWQEGSAKEWNYIRVEGLGIFPGLVCPHYDRIQSNGVPRMFDFDKMMSRHSLELGLGIDHFAALEINGEDFRILSIPGASGSVPHVEDEESLNVPMVPGAWIKFVDEDGAIQSKACPSSGKIEDLLQALVDPSKHIWPDGRVEICRQQNPGPSTD
ncbi:hypothetical protein HJC23_003714 [Cyclotella cryptica]|uniref:Uncharacterized protein n=1 Tax=Cyclotella cryptica TaxID=29204 RepID=A0ABD3QTS3_9STRA|eukprot:CCRYP_002107-RA/>CCRYP_002107-RA protein AED:0.34 eAED:0.34 QI:290/1/1/1/1/1/2/1371/379